MKTPNANGNQKAALSGAVSKVDPGAILAEVDFGLEAATTALGGFFILLDEHRQRIDNAIAETGVKIWSADGALARGGRRQLEAYEGVEMALDALSHHVMQELERLRRDLKNARSLMPRAA